MKSKEAHIEHPHKLHLLSKPYLYWLYILAIVPMVMMFLLMFVDSEGISLDEMTFAGFTNFLLLGEKSVIVAFYNSVRFSISTTIICLILGYNLAYALHKSKFKNKYLILLLLILPMWSNILIRILALRNVMQENNILTSFIEYIFHLESNSVVFSNILGTDLAILIGCVITYLPFVILPIYTALEKIDPSLIEASTDLGMTEMRTFWKVTFPLTFKGITSGTIMVLLPCLSGFAIPTILGNGNILLIGNIIEQYFNNMNYNNGSILAVIILIVILSAITLINKVDKEGETLI
jgi:spermidine/putrescine transport system permease protein